MKLSHLLLIAIAVFSLIACSKSSSSNTGTVHDYLINGQWFVHMFTEGSTDKTSNYAGYKFTFDGLGTFVVVKDDVETHGTWTDDVSSGKLIINMSTIDPNLQQLIDNWVVSSKVYNLIEMHDDSGDHIFHLKKL